MRYETRGPRLKILGLSLEVRARRLLIIISEGVGGSSGLVALSPPLCMLLRASHVMIAESLLPNLEDSVSTRNVWRPCAFSMGFQCYSTLCTSLFAQLTNLKQSSRFINLTAPSSLEAGRLRSTSPFSRFEQVDGRGVCQKVFSYCQLFCESYLFVSRRSRSTSRKCLLTCWSQN